ncbi:MAG: hypothetical protein JSU86_18360 [Phycisphaerales bacterium]|nr:MAG: hypothetical protein JSU86_18360 [Phycisphaerales bacterium]
MAFLLGTGAALCVPGCQTQRSARYGVRDIHLTRLDGYLEFVARDRTREQESKVQASKTEVSETIFEESISLETEGYIHLPHLFEFTLGAVFGKLQQDFETVFGGRSRTSSEDGSILEFDLEGQFLKTKSYPTWIRARRHQSLEPRPFQTSLETTTTNYGLVWQYISKKTPTSIRFDYTDVLIDPLGHIEENKERTNSDFQFDTAYRFTTHNILSLEYRHELHRERPARLDYDADEVTLEHRLDFGEGHRDKLESELNYRNQRGTYDLERLRLRETLRLTHSDRLRSWYQFEALDRTRGSLTGIPDIGERSYYLSGTVERRFYDNLLTQWMGFVQRQDFDSGIDIRRYGVLANFDYYRHNPWGRLEADYSIRLEREDREGAFQAGERIEEPKTFRDPNPVILTTPRIDIGSIVIKDEDLVTVYRMGRDYTVRTVGNQVEIERVPTGRIVDGQTVLIDYIFELGGTFKLDTISQNLGVRQRFDFGLSPYYRLRKQDQRLSPEKGSGVVPEDITAHIFGLEFRRGSLSLMGEYESHDSTITPFDALRLTADFRRRFKNGATGNVRARWVDTNYDHPNKRETRFFTAEVSYHHPITNTLTVEGAVLYRDVTDSRSGDDNGIDLDLSLEWFIRDTEIRVTYEYGRFEDDFADSRASALFVMVRRNF